MDTFTYGSLLHKTKASLCNNVQVDIVSFPGHFTALLEDCRLCVTQSLDLIVNILLDSDLELRKLSQYMEDAVDLMQLLTSFIRNVVESISMSCCRFNTFPTTTGHIIMLIFTHCKNSESVYGVHLNNMQKQLKDLFRTCHELQLTYLMVLEKHFIFDLTEGGQLAILIDALNINLKIGEVVQSLDVKTMAEQWKVYMALCEKYASHLMDKQTFQQCTRLLCIMITNNLRNAAEPDQEFKVVVRSLKVTNFTIKILLKMCSIFKHATTRDYTEIVDLLFYIYLHNPAYLESIEGRSPQFMNAMSVNVCNPSDILLKELIIDEKFLNVVLSCNINELKEERLLGYTLLVVSIAKCSLHRNKPSLNYSKDKLLLCLFKLLPKCHLWLNIGLQFKSNHQPESQQYAGLFEYMLVNAVALALTMTCEEMCRLERTMYEALLGTESFAAMFASNLWVTLARMSDNRQFLFSQVVSLCQIYQKLEKNKSFLYSPQKLHISHTISALFETMHLEERLRMFKQFNPMDDRRNISIWSILKINKLPNDLQGNVQEEIVKRYSTLSSLQAEDSIEELIQVTRLASSCLFLAEEVEESLVEAWLRACPVACGSLAAGPHGGSLWYIEYIEALVSWTAAVEHIFWDNSSNLIKVLHVMSSLMKIGNVEVNLLLIDLLCSLSNIPVHNENKQSVAALMKESFKSLAECSNALVRNKLFITVTTSNNKNLVQLICSISNDCEDAWNSFVKISKSNNIVKLKEVLLETSDYKFLHKCLEKHDYEEIFQPVDKIEKTCSNNFDFADLDSLFDNPSDSEPASKKLKLDSSEAETILDRLENDTSLLFNVMENMITSEHRRRIRGVCERLKSLVT